MACQRCESEPQPANFGSPRRCAFPHGTFHPENWNCATVSELLDHESVTESYSNDESINVVPVLDESLGGWIVLTRYKRRGCTSSAVRMGDFHPYEALTLEFCERVLATRK